MALIESGMPIVLIPGLLNTEALWRAQIEGLSDLGNTPPVTEHREYASLAEIADRTLARAPERFVLGGLSMGGYIAFEIWRQAPERVAALALLDTSARPDTAEQSAGRHEAMRVARAQGLQTVLDNLLPKLVYSEHLSDAALVQTMTDMAHSVGVDAFERQQTAIMARPDSRALLAEITCPTLVLCGRDDALTPPEVAREMADGIPDAELVIVERCGHLAPLEQPTEVTRAMRQWLGG